MRNGSLPEENDALAQRAWEFANQHNPNATEDVHATNLVWHEPDRGVRGVEQAKQYDFAHLSAFSDPFVTVEEIITGGDEVASHWAVGGMTRMAVNVLAALALCGLALTLVLLLASDISWAAVLEWLTTSGPSLCEYLR